MYAGGGMHQALPGRDPRRGLASPAVRDEWGRDKSADPEPEWSCGREHRDAEVAAGPDRAWAEPAVVASVPPYRGAEALLDARPVVQPNSGVAVDAAAFQVWASPRAPQSPARPARYEPQAEREASSRLGVSARPGAQRASAAADRKESAPGAWLEPDALEWDRFATEDAAATKAPRRTAEALWVTVSSAAVPPQLRRRLDDPRSLDLPHRVSGASIRTPKLSGRARAFQARRERPQQCAERLLQALARQQRPTSLGAACPPARCLPHALSGG